MADRTFAVGANLTASREWIEDVAQTTWRARCAAPQRERRGENRHETGHRVALHLLGRLLRNPIQHRSACLRHDPPGGLDRARRAARLSFRRAPPGDTSSIWIAGHLRILPAP